MESARKSFALDTSSGRRWSGCANLKIFGSVSLSILGGIENIILRGRSMWKESILPSLTDISSLCSFRYGLIMSGDTESSQETGPVMDKGGSLRIETSPTAQTRPGSGHDQPASKKEAAFPSCPKDSRRGGSLILEGSLIALDLFHGSVLHIPS